MKFRYFVIVIMVFGLFLLTSCLDDDGESSGSSSQSVPYNVQIAAMQHLGIDSTQGGEILSISGKEEESYVDGSELWSVSVRYKLCSSCGTDSINTKIQVR